MLLDTVLSEDVCVFSTDRLQVHSYNKSTAEGVLMPCFHRLKIILIGLVIAASVRDHVPCMDSMRATAGKHCIHVETLKGVVHIQTGISGDESHTITSRIQMNRV